MKNVALVLLVSRETIPNFLAVKTFTEAQSYVFITTMEMEDEHKGNRREWLINAANINTENSFTILVNAYNKEEINKKLNEFDWDRFDDVIVNLTGGTKLMALACYQFFFKKTGHLWYTPENNNQSYILVDNSSFRKNIDYKLSVSEYLACCGIYKHKKKYTEKSPYLHKEFTQKFFENFILKKLPLKSIEFLRIKFRGNEATKEDKKLIDKGINLDTYDIGNEVKKYITDLNYEPSINSGCFSKKDLEYITGGWFEEYIYHLISQKINDPEKIRLGIVLNPKASKSDKAAYFTNNDLDVVFTHNNALYVVECKSGGMNDNELFNKTVYLASALRRYFGLTVKSVLCTLSSMTEEQKEKAETLGISSFDLSTFTSESAIDIISGKLNL